MTEEIQKTEEPHSCLSIQEAVKKKCIPCIQSFSKLCIQYDDGYCCSDLEDAYAHKCLMCLSILKY